MLDREWMTRLARVETSAEAGCSVWTVIAIVCSCSSETCCGFVVSGRREYVRHDHTVFNSGVVGDICIAYLKYYGESYRRALYDSR